MSTEPTTTDAGLSSDTHVIEVDGELTALEERPSAPISAGNLVAYYHYDTVTVMRVERTAGSVNVLRPVGRGRKQVLKGNSLTDIIGVVALKPVSKQP